MSIEVAIRHRLGSFALDAAFTSHGSLTAIFGASGSGKTTLINAIAGLIQPDSARVVIDGRTISDTSRGIALPVHHRRIGYVFQDARLFPHLTVEQNIAYGRWFAPRGERYADPAHILALLGIASLLARRPSQLSGGEKQRVAIARALLASPRLLLMDEPLASLDQPRKDEILPHIEQLRDGLRIPIIYVSHSVAEVMRLATDVVVMAEGRVAAHGAAADIAQRLDLVPPEERDEGGTVLDMRISGYDEGFDMTSLTSDAGSARVPGRIGAPGAMVRVRIRARDVMIATEAPRNISALNILSGTVAGLDSSERASVTVRIDCNGTLVLSRITRLSCAALELAPGKPVFAVIKAVSVASPSATPHQSRDAAISPASASR